MQEIKFRAWDNINKKMFDVSRISFWTNDEADSETKIY